MAINGTCHRIVEVEVSTPVRTPLAATTHHAEARSPDERYPEAGREQVTRSPSKQIYYIYFFDQAIARAIMGGGLAFLTKKQFNPANISNQKRVWEAEQRAEKEARAARERAEQLKRERDDEELARARGGRTGGDRAALGFMYGPPPGLADEKKTGAGDNDGEDPFGPRGGFGRRRR